MGVAEPKRGYSQASLGAAAPDSPNCPPALASAPSPLPNCMSESRVRGDMGRSMVLLKVVLTEGEAQSPLGSEPG